ncbi:MAG: hypothetical protein PHS73_03325, partial [Candidatus Peribacteraceae bacterium]|nr:hypothetical protein [Candidatus Peribacteraceae bacterium]
MLIRNVLARFAGSVPPERERREIMFADQHPTNPNPQDPDEQTEQPESPSPERTPGGEGETIEGSMQGTHGQISETLRSLDTQEVFAALNVWNFDMLPDLEDTLAGGDLRQAAETAGIMDVLRNRGAAPATDDPRTVLDAILLADDAEEVPADAKRKFLQKLLERNPHVTLSLAGALGGRLQSYEEQQRRLDNCRQETGKAWDAFHAEAVKIAKRMPVTDANGNQRPYSIDDALAKLRTTSRAAFMSQKLTRPRETLQNTSDAIRIMEDYGARYWGSAGEAVSPEA